MQTLLAQALSVILFIVVVVILFSMALRTLYRSLRDKKPRGPVDTWLRRKPALILAWVILIGGTGCILYGFLIEPTWMKVTTYTITSPKIPSGKQIRIVHIADLHVREYGPREQQLPELVASLKPDIILHTGDFFGGHPEEERIVAELLMNWEVPQYTCSGNQDRMRRIFEETMAAAEVRILKQETEPVTIRGIPCTITGFPSRDELSMQGSLKKLPVDTLNIVLYHHPQGFPSLFNTPADLMLAGHTHGGQIRLPFYGALITMDLLGKRYESGLYPEKKKHLVVSRGLGCEPGIPEVRFLCRPEVVVIDIVGE